MKDQKFFPLPSTLSKILGEGLSTGPEPYQKLDEGQPRRMCQTRKRLESDRQSGELKQERQKYFLVCNRFFSKFVESWKGWLRRLSGLEKVQLTWDGPSWKYVVGLNVGMLLGPVFGSFP